MATRRKKATRKSVMNKARTILKQQKADYKRIFKREIRKGGDSKKAAVRAGSVYRSTYGSTATRRWENALKKAKNGR